MIENTWAFPALEALHVVGLALLVGTIALGDLKVLGITAAAAPANTLSIGLWLVIITGIAMFLADSERCRANPAFLLKMGILVVALLSHYTIHKRETRTTAVLSLALWTFTVVAARAIIDFDA